jgi:uncharacterized protein YaaQ
MKKQTSKRGRPAIYTKERIQKLVALMKKTGRSLKSVIASVNSKNGSHLKYVPCLVAMKKQGMNLRPR